MDKEYTQAVRDLAARRTAPVDEAKRALQSTKVVLLMQAEKCDEAAARVRPIGMKLQARLVEADKLGVGVPIAIRDRVRRAFGTGLGEGLLDSAARTCRMWVERIDGLSPTDLYHGVLPKKLAHAPQETAGLVRDLKALGTAFEKDLETVEALIRTAAGSPPAVLTVNPPEPRAQVVVESGNILDLPPMLGGR